MLRRSSRRTGEEPGASDSAAPDSALVDLSRSIPARARQDAGTRASGTCVSHASRKRAASQPPADDTDSDRDATTNRFDISESDTVLNFAYKDVTDQDMITIASLIRVKGAHLKELRLSWNRIGDAGVISLAEACAFTKLEKLYLFRNHIRDAGCTALANACAKGALASLKDLYVGNEQHPELKAACQARGITLH